MKFEFNTTLEQVNCYIRTYGYGPILPERVSQNPHKHAFVEFHCILAGEETVYLPETRKEIRLSPGQILLLPQDVYHGVKTENETVERLCFNLRMDTTEKGRSSELEQLLEMKEVQLFDDPLAIGFARHCRDLRCQESLPLADARQGLLMLSIVLQLYSSLFGSRPSPAHNNARASQQKWIIEEYIEGHFTDSDGIEGLAEALYLSQRQTRTLVHRFLGEDYKSIIIRRRMELAEIYLRDPEKTLEDVAALVGYRSYSGFQLCFKRYFGITPSQMRKKFL